MKIPRISTYLLIGLIFCSFVMAACQKEDHPAQDSSPKKELPEALEKMEMGIMEIMSQADLIPVVPQGEGEVHEQEMEESDARPLTFDETLLAEVLKKEMETVAGGQMQSEEEERQFPQNTVQIWDEIKMSISQLHSWWDELEARLNQVSVSRDSMAEFEAALDHLTISSAEQAHLATLTAANLLTKYLAEFRAPFSEGPAPAAFSLKYHLRNVVLAAAGNDYHQVQESLAQLKEQGQAPAARLMELDEQDLALQYHLSLENLERALARDDLNLVKINAAVVMENIVQMIRLLAE